MCDYCGLKTSCSFSHRLAHTLYSLVINKAGRKTSRQDFFNLYKDKVWAYFGYYTDAEEKLVVRS